MSIRIAIVFLQTNYKLNIENCVQSFLLNNTIEPSKMELFCVHKTPIQNPNEHIKYIKIPDEVYYLDQLIQLDDFDLLCLSTNTHILDQNVLSDDRIQYFMSHTQYGQIIFTKTDYINSNIHIRKINNYEYRYNSYKQIFQNVSISKYTEPINYTDYSKKIYSSKFILLPSLIKIKSISTKYFPLYPNSIFQRFYNNIFCNKRYETLYYELNLNPNTSEIIYNNPKSEEVTIVTAFLKVNEANKKHKYDYIQKAIPTLSLPNPMVIYISEDLVDYVKEIRTEKGLLEKTKIIILKLTDFYMYDKKSILDEYCKKNISPYNNSLYIMAVNSRYSYLEKAIENNHFQTNYFAWLDFGLSHIVYMDNIKNITYNNPLQIKIAWIARKNLSFNHKCLGGGIYVGHKNIMKLLCSLHDQEFRFNLTLGHCVNDDKTLFFIFLKYPELFDIFFSSYNTLYNNTLNS